MLDSFVRVLLFLLTWLLRYDYDDLDMKISLSNLRKTSGFTLIELLVVIAVLGVLAAIVLLAVNPAEQLARSRDAGRISAVTQLGRSLQSYYTVNSTGTNPLPTPVSWITTLKNSNEIKTIPAANNYSGGSSACNTSEAGVGVEKGYCYKTNNVEAVVFSRLESQNQTGKCSTGGVAWVVFSTEQGKSGIVCTAGASSNPGITGLTFVE